MKQDQEPRTLSQLLDRIEETANRDEQISLDAILEAVGHRSFGPVLLLAGLVMLAPIIGDIPGVPSIMGVLVVLTAGQLLFHRQRIWLPRWLLKRSVKASCARRSSGCAPQRDSSIVCCDRASRCLPTTPDATSSRSCASSFL